MPTYSERFETIFWKLYPRRVGRLVGKVKTYEYFKKLSDEDQLLCCRAAGAYAQYFTRRLRAGEFRPEPRDPERFLRMEWWRDWLEPTAKPCMFRSISQPCENLALPGGTHCQEHKDYLEKMQKFRDGRSPMMDKQTTQEPQSASEILKNIAEKAAVEDAKDGTLSFIPPEPAPATDPGTGIAITRHLPITLTEARKLELLDELAGHVNEYNRLEEHKKTMAGETAKAMKYRRGEMDNISATVTQGIEMKPIPCRKDIDYVQGRVTVTRLDTGKVIEDKALEEEDMKQ